MKTRTIKQTLTLDATPHEVYELLMDSEKHSHLIGAAAKISKKVGGRFFAFDGGITGKNLEVVPDKKIVQSWRIEEWKPKDYFTKVKFLLKQIKNKKTKLTLIHEKVPKEEYKDVKEGWTEYYFGPMKEMLAQT